MSYLEELLPEFRKGAKIRCSDWIDGFYIQKDGQTVIDHNNYTFHIHAEDALSDKWELYQEPIDWDYIIKNKCLCWFWDDHFDGAAIGLLKNAGAGFFTWQDNAENTACFDHCRPVRRDEVTFYEDR